MSDCISQKFSKREVFELVLGNTDIREPAQPYHMQWMAHWNRASSSTTLHIHEHFSVTNSSKDQIKGKCYLPIEGMKPRYTCDCRNIWRHKTKKQLLEARGSATGGVNVVSNCVAVKNVTSVGGEAIEIQSIPDSATNWGNFTLKHFQNSKDPSIDWEHFPMFNINRKMETIIARKKSTSSNTRAEFAYEEYQHQLQNVTQNDQEKMPYVSLFSSAHCDFCTQNEVGDDAFRSHLENENGTSIAQKPCNCSTTNIGAQGTSSSFSSKKKETRKFLNATQCLSKRKEVSKNLCRADLKNIKGAAFSEKHSLPSILCHHGRQDDNLQPHLSSINYEEDSQFEEKQTDSLGKNDAMNLDDHHTPSSPGVESSSKSQKMPQDPVHPKLQSLERPDKGTSESSHQIGNKQIPEPSYKWVKRLSPNPSDPIPVTTKRFKVGDASSSGEMHNLLARVVHYNGSISDTPECQQLDKIVSLAKNGEFPCVESAKLMPWIRRWCQNNKEKSPQPTVFCEPQNSKVVPEKFEAKQFPSLAAMALVGKQVINFRPCEFRKRGSTVVWNV